MASERLLQLPDAANAEVTDVIYAVKGSSALDPNSGTSVQETMQQVCDLTLQTTILHYGDDPNGHVAGTTYQLCYDYTHMIMYVCTHTGDATHAVWTQITSNTLITIPLPMADGGTGADLVPSNGGVVYSDATHMEILAGTSTADKILQSGSNSAPSWSQATYPSSTSSGQLLYSSSNNTIAGLTSANSAMLFTNSSGVPAWSSSLINGQIMIGSTGASPAVATITAGTNITITNGPGSISIAATGVVSVPVPLSQGGTGANLTASNGGIVYSTAANMQILSGTATARQIVLSGSNTAPAWSSATYPATTTINQLLYSSSANTIAGLATANNGVLVTSAGGVPSIGSTLPAAVQANITAVGIIASGTWNGSTITVPYGGTGDTSFTAYSVICGGTTSTGALQNVSGVGSANQVLVSNGPAALPSWQSVPGVVPAALTKTDDTNVTLLLGGTPATALLQSVSLTLGWAGQLSLARGGTNANLTASNGGIFYSTATAGAILAGTATANQVLLSGSSTTPAWSTATYPATTTINQLLYSSANNVISGVTAANSAVLVSNSSGVPAWSSTMTNGQVIIGSTGATPVAATLTAGAGVTISNGAGSITIASSGGGFSWTHVTGTSQAMVSNNGYVADNAGLVTLTLPATAVIGDALAIMGRGAGGWKITYTTNQYIQVGSSGSTVTSGNIASTNRFDSIYLVCIDTNNGWSTLGGAQGIITVA